MSDELPNSVYAAGPSDPANNATETREVFNNAAQSIGFLSLPVGTAEFIWALKIAQYASLPGLPFIVNLINTLTATSTGAITTSSATPGVLGGMTQMPSAGTYLAFFSGNASTVGASAQGEFGIYVNTVLIAETRREIKCNLALLGGLVTVSLNQIGVGTYTSTQVDLDGTQTIDVRYKSNNGGTIGFAERNLILLRVK